MLFLKMDVYFHGSAPRDFGWHAYHPCSTLAVSLKARAAQQLSAGRGKIEDAQ